MANQHAGVEFISENNIKNTKLPIRYLSISVQYLIHTTLQSSYYNNSKIDTPSIQTFRRIDFRHFYENLVKFDMVAFYGYE